MQTAEHKQKIPTAANTSETFDQALESNATVSALTSHNLGAVYADLLAKDQQNNTQFCATCHKDLTKR